MCELYGQSKASIKRPFPYHLSGYLSPHETKYQFQETNFCKMTTYIYIYTYMYIQCINESQRIKEIIFKYSQPKRICINNTLLHISGHVVVNISVMSLLQKLIYFFLKCAYSSRQRVTYSLAYVLTWVSFVLCLLFYHVYYKVMAFIMGL